ncbi:MAG: class I SAM-dependent methyltransferase [Bacteroidota bacterium]|nr:class I SAM-dependent methyltransferase [Bacteroidota bacterium]
MQKIRSFIKRKIFRIDKDRWDYQYAKGNWEGLKSEDELQRIYIARDLIIKYGWKGNILEIGCGEGIFFNIIPTDQYTYYEGIDISEIAINKTPEIANTKFAAADMENYQPTINSFNYIIMNEVLYYSKNPMQLLKKYHPYLSPNGVFLIGMYISEKSEGIWKSIDENYSVIESVSIKQGDKTWLYKVLK